jgi:hypothetical protein
MTVGIFQQIKKNPPQKVFFLLNGTFLPPLLNGTNINERTYIFFLPLDDYKKIACIGGGGGRGDQLRPCES